MLAPSVSASPTSSGTLLTYVHRQIPIPNGSAAPADPFALDPFTSTMCSSFGGGGSSTNVYEFGELFEVTS
jgi:hypothetical protein